jgi:hypothetical protein
MIYCTVIVGNTGIDYFSIVQCPYLLSELFILWYTQKIYYCNECYFPGNAALIIFSLQLTVNMLNGNVL